jgi:hypothetical protein
MLIWQVLQQLVGMRRLPSIRRQLLCCFSVSNDSPSGIPCPAGSYSDVSGAFACSPCPSGKYGASSAACTGACNPGFFCPAGSVNCGGGTYSLGSAGVCTDCPAGLYGTLVDLTTANCTAPCRPGAYGATGGLTSPGCSGNCSAGYACPTGSTTPTAQLCPTGRYSTAGSGVCPECPAGVYGDSVGLKTPACSGLCAVGYVCPPASNSSTPTPSCPAGRYGDIVTSTCVDCPTGRFGPLSGAASATSAGIYGSSSGLTVARCSGPCPAGYYCSGGCVVVANLWGCFVT